MLRHVLYLGLLDVSHACKNKYTRTRARAHTWNSTLIKRQECNIQDLDLPLSSLDQLYTKHVYNHHLTLTLTKVFLTQRHTNTHPSSLTVAEIWAADTAGLCKGQLHRDTGLWVLFAVILPLNGIDISKDLHVHVHETFIISYLL